jgi:hypothetical protein
MSNRNIHAVSHDKVFIGSHTFSRLEIEQSLRSMDSVPAEVPRKLSPFKRMTWTFLEKYIERGGKGELLPGTIAYALLDLRDFALETAMAVKVLRDTTKKEP